MMKIRIRTVVGGRKREKVETNLRVEKKMKKRVRRVKTKIEKVRKRREKRNIVVSNMRNIV